MDVVRGDVVSSCGPSQCRVYDCRARMNIVVGAVDLMMNWMMILFVVQIVMERLFK